MPEVVKFGAGNISVSAGLQVPDMDTVVGLCFIEPNLGAGAIGANVPERPEGKAIWPLEVEGVVLEFSTIASVEVVIDQLQDLRQRMTSALEDTNVRQEYFDKGQAAIVIANSAQESVQ